MTKKYPSIFEYSLNIVLFFASLCQDVAMDDELPEDERKKLEQAFNQYDNDNDGELTFSEFQKLVSDTLYSLYSCRSTFYITTQARKSQYWWCYWPINPRVGGYISHDTYTLITECGSQTRNVPHDVTQKNCVYFLDCFLRPAQHHSLASTLFINLWCSTVPCFFRLNINCTFYLMRCCINDEHSPSQPADNDNIHLLADSCSVCSIYVTNSLYQL